MAAFLVPPASSSFGLSLSLKPPGRPLLLPSISTTNNKKPFFSLVANSNGKFSNGRYIREDYLIKKVTSKQVDELVKGERNVPLVVDFYAT